MRDIFTTLELPQEVRSHFYPTAEEETGRNKGVVGLRTSAGSSVRLEYNATIAARALEYYQEDYSFYGINHPIWLKEVLAEAKS